MRLLQTRAVLAVALSCVFGSPSSSQPLLFFVSPQEVVEADAEVELIAEYYARGADVDPSTFTATFDRMPVEYRCRTDETRAECLLWSSLPGAHRLLISIADAEGNRADASMIFEQRGADADRDGREPYLSVGTPDPGHVFLDTSVDVVVGYRDEVSGAGIDLGSLLLRLNGVDILDHCEPPDGLGVDCRLEDLAPGDYLLQVSIADLTGNVAIEEVPFLRLPIPEGDTEPPEVKLRLHQRPIDQAPMWDLVFHDSKSGVDPASVVITLDGEDPTEPCNVISVVASCPTVTLVPGRHRIGVGLSDRAGNVETTVIDFEVDPGPGPPL